MEKGKELTGNREERIGRSCIWGAKRLRKHGENGKKGDLHQSGNKVSRNVRKAKRCAKGDGTFGDRQTKNAKRQRAATGRNAQPVRKVRRTILITGSVCLREGVDISLAGERSSEASRQSATLNAPMSPELNRAKNSLPAALRVGEPNGGRGTHSDYKNY